MNEGLLLWGLALLAAALLLIFVEVFVPSGGLISLTAVVLAISGVVCLFRVSVVWGITGLLAAIILGPLMGFFALNILPSTPMGKRLIHGAGEEDEEGEEGEGRMGPDPTLAEMENLIGQEGVAVTDLRLVGTVRINGKKYPAISEMSLVRAGTRVRVSAADGVQVRVRPIT